MAWAVAVAVLLAGLAGCGDGTSPNAPVPTGSQAKAFRGTDSGVEFRYQGGDLRVDLTDAPQQVKNQVLGKRVEVACGSVQAARRWPQGEQELGFALSIEPVEEDPQQSQPRRCRLKPLAVPEPVAQAELKRAKGDFPPAGSPSRP